MAWLRAGQVELTLQVVAGYLDILHRHLGLDMAEERHQCGQTDAGAHHLTGICVSKLMGNDTGGNADRSCSIGQIRSQLFDQGLLAFVACQEPAVSGEEVERAKEAQALDEFTYKRVHGDYSFWLQLAEWHMNRPAVGAQIVEAIIGEVGAFSDAHAGMAK